MIDPLLVIFAPYAVAATGVIASPLIVGRALAWRHRAKRLNARTCCGRCERPFTLDEDFHVYLGRYICAPCATTLRRRWRIGLSLSTLAVGTMALGAGTAFIADIASGGSALEWWLGPRLLALAVPSCGLLATVPFILRLGRRANRIDAVPVPTALLPDA